MKAVIWIWVIVALAIVVGACTDTTRAKLSAYGEAGHIVCYSGGQVILDDWSTGRVQKEEGGSDGYGYLSATTGLLTESNGDCVVKHGEKRP